MHIGKEKYGSYPKKKTKQNIRQSFVFLMRRKQKHLGGQLKTFKDEVEISENNYIQTLFNHP